MEVAEELRTPKLIQLVERFVAPEGDSDFEMSDFDKFGLLAVLARLVQRRGWKAESSTLFKMTRAFLVETLEDVEDFKALAEFKRLFPDAFQASEWRQLDRRLEDRANDWKLEFWNDEDALWGLRSDVEELKDAFGGTARGITCELEDRALELERDKEEPDRTPYQASPNASSDESEEIRALFASLLTR
jgi:hypothetical protein